jgi:hypothetical protein
VPVLHVVGEHQPFRLETVTPEPWPALVHDYLSRSARLSEDAVLRSEDWTKSVRRDVRIYERGKYIGVLPLNAFLLLHQVTLSRLRESSG